MSLTRWIKLQKMWCGKTFVIMPRPIGWGIKRWWLSLCLSRMEGHSKLKIGRRKAHDTGDPWPHLGVERSRSLGRLMLRRKIRHIFQKGDGRTSNLVQRWSTMTGMHRQARWRHRSNIKVKGQRSMLQRHVISLTHLPITRQRKVAETQKLARKLSVPRQTFRTTSKVKRSKVTVKGHS